MKARAADTWPDTPRNRTAIAERWAKGRDTLRIARSVGLTEPDVCRILARLQDERYAARQREGAGV
ncbi:conserved protein of unknown function [Methylorubrum extorquens]|uniref:Uncharacterized protein n=1 Tax=Methylorubrum extorquens TaxID=408 RepID=A0A2N9AHG8_METEX|nr:conserved protein of unknown function [Methylorubrum extorquens]